MTFAARHLGEEGKLIQPIKAVFQIHSIVNNINQEAGFSVSRSLKNTILFFRCCEWPVFADSRRPYNLDSRVASNDPLESVLRAFRRPRSSGKRTYGGRRHVNDRQLSQSYNSAGLATNKGGFIPNP